MVYHGLPVPKYRSKIYHGTIITWHNCTMVDCTMVEFVPWYNYTMVYRGTFS